MHISICTLEFMAAWFGEQSLAYRALQDAKALGGDCFFVLIHGQYLVGRRAY